MEKFISGRKIEKSCKLTIVSISMAITISMAISISMVSISIRISIISIASISLSISTTLATGNMLEGVTGGVELIDAMNGSIVRKTKRNSISVKSITRLSISATLAKSLGRSGYEGCGTSRVSSNTKTMKTISISKGIAVSISKISWLSISTTLATTAKAGRGAEGGGHTWPVGVGIIQSRGSKEISWLSIGRWGSGDSCGQAGGNQKFVHGFCCRTLPTEIQSCSDPH